MNINNYQNELNKKQKDLDEFKEKLLKQGLIIYNGEIFERKKIFVMEVLLKGETQYESYGQFMIKRGFLVLSNEELNKIKEILAIKDNKYKKEQFIDLLETFYSRKEIKNVFDIVDLGYGCIREENITHIYTPDNSQSELILDIYLDSDYGKWDGYISVFETDFDKYSYFKEKCVDVTVKKIITQN